MSARPASPAAPQTRPRVALVTTNAIFDEFLAAKLREFGVEVIGSWREAGSACRTAAGRDVIVLSDARNADGPLEEVLDCLGQDGPRLVIYAAKFAYDTLRRLSGVVDGFALHSDPLRELVTVFEAVAAGERRDSPGVAELLRRPEDGPPEPIVPVAVAGLSAQQVEIIRLLAMGATVKEVARQTYRSPKSIDGHKYRIMRELGLKDRVELTHFAIACGLVEPRYELLAHVDGVGEDTVVG